MPDEPTSAPTRVRHRARRATEVSEQTRAAIAEIEEQRDDAVAYLSTIKLILEVLTRGQGRRQCAQEIAELMVRQLALESCAVVMRDANPIGIVLAGFATQAQRLGGGRDELGETGWLRLVQLVGTELDAAICFRRKGDGSFTAVPAGELHGEGFCVLPFTVGGEGGNALVLHSLAAPAQVFGRARALALVADIVGQTLTVANTRDALESLCGNLESELGVTRRALSAQQESLRSNEENIQSLTQALIRSNRVKREFLGTVSHELRTPLNAILGYSSLVRDGMCGPLNDEQERVLERVVGNTRNLNALIDDILFFVQVESDRLLLRPQRVVVAELFDEALDALPGRPSPDKVAFHIEIAPEAAHLYVDGSLLRRIVFHLLSNAFKFTAGGEIAVTLTPVGQQEKVELTVRDTGCGIPADRVSELFEAFSQGDSSTTRKYAGLGMGLTLVERCVRLLGGEVRVESQTGQGSTFTVSLPGVLDEPSPAEGPRSRHGMQ